MDSNEMYTVPQAARLNSCLLTAALNALHNLVAAVDNDLFMDALECRSGINRAEDAIQDAHKALVQIQAELGQDHGGWSTDPSDSRARRILCEAEDAFEVVSMAHERASCGDWPAPALVQDYLFWIEDEARVQENSALLRSSRRRGSDLYPGFVVAGQRVAGVGLSTVSRTMAKDRADGCWGNWPYCHLDGDKSQPCRGSGTLRLLE